MDRITRKELKRDKFALEVGHTVEFLGEHRRQVVRYGAVGLAVIIVAVGLFYYSRSQRTARERGLNTAMEILRAPVGPANAQERLTFSSQEEKNKAVVKALSDFSTRYAGTDEGTIARYLLAAIAADQGKFDEAVKLLGDIAGSGGEGYASLARLALAQVYAQQGKTAEAEKLLRALIAKPTIMLSKQQATIALGRLLASKNPAETRKLLDPLRTEPGVVGRAAVDALGEIPAGQ